MRYRLALALAFICFTSSAWAQSYPKPQLFQAYLNLTLAASVSSSQLTITVNDPSGNAPSTAHPILAAFRTQTLTGGSGGASIFGAITAATSFTASTTSSLGCVTTVLCRLWVELICQTESTGSCTAILVGMSVQSVGGSVPVCYPLMENNLQATGSGTTGGTTINTIQTSVASLSGKAIRIAGYVEATWTSGTGWAIASSPTNPVVELFGPGIHKPCAVVQDVYSGPIASTQAIGSSQTQTTVTAAITPTSAINQIRATAVVAGLAGSSGTLAFRLSRGTSPTLFGETAGIANNSANNTFPVRGTDTPATTSSTSYYVFGIGVGNSSSFTVNGGTGTSDILLEEIMG